MSEYYQELKLIEPKFWSKLADLIFESADLWLRDEEHDYL